MTVGLQIWYNGMEFWINLFPLFMFLFITKVLPVICPHYFFKIWENFFYIKNFVQSYSTDIVSIFHYDDVIMMAIASQITTLTIVYSTVYSGAHQRKHQSSASLAFVRGIHRGPVNSPHKWPVTRKMFPFDDVIMSYYKSRVSCQKGPICHA